MINIFDNFPLTGIYRIAWIGDSVAEEMWSFAVPLLVVLYFSVHTSGSHVCDPSWTSKRAVDHTKLYSKYYRSHDVANSNEGTLKLVHVVSNYITFIYHFILTLVSLRIYTYVN